MYAKIFASIYQGTLRGNTNGLVVFTNMLAHADSAGWVDIHPRAISEETGLPIEKVREAIAELSAPDPESRSPEEEGRRIVLLDDHRDWGWRVVNHGKYRAIKSEEDRRIANREYQQRHRDKLKASACVSDHKHPLAQSAHTEAEAEADTKNTHRAKALSTPDGVSQVVWDDFIKHRKNKKAPVTATAIAGIRREAEKAGWTLESALAEICARGWSGFKAEWAKDEPSGTAAMSLMQRMGAK